MTANNISPEEAIASNAANSLIAQALFALDKAAVSDKNIDYKPLYYYLFNGVSDIIDSLKQLQRDAEDHFLNQPEQETGQLESD